MKKFTKRLTMIVAILLSLVLLSSSIVSTTLAKYVTSKKATTTATLSAFGVEVKLEGTGSTEKKGDSITYTDTINLIPEATYQTITASIKGKPAVEATINIDVDLEYVGNYTITAASKAFDSIKEDKTYYPVGFKVGASSGNYTVTPYSSTSATTASQNIEEAIKSKLTALNFSNPSDGLSNTWGTETEIATETDISIHFHWPKTYGTADQMYDEIGTYLSKDGAQKVKITYTISVTQN